MLRCEKPREACSHRGRSNDDNQVIPEILLCLFLISAFGIGSTHYWRLSRYRSLQLNERKNPRRISPARADYLHSRAAIFCSSRCCNNLCLCSNWLSAASLPLPCQS